jgi:fatty acid desaturase
MTHLDKHTLRELHRPGWHGTLVVAVFGGVYYATVAAMCWSWSQHHDTLFAIFLAINVYCSHSLVIAFHEASHGSLCPWWPLNEYLGRVIGLQGCVSLTLYRELHHWHHAYLGTPRDEEFWPFTDPANSRWKRRLAALGELGFGTFYTPFLYLRALVRRGSRMQLSRRKQALIWVETLSPLVVWGSLGTWCWWRGWFDYFLMAWVLPVWLTGNIQSWRKYIEHIGLLGHNWLTLTRAIRPTTWAGYAVSQSVLHEPFHDLHHRYPKIPYENLPAAATQLDAVGEQTNERPLFANYWEACRDLLRTLGDPKFGPAWRTATQKE